MVASRPFPSLGLHTMKLQVWIKAQTEQITWSNVWTDTLSAGHRRHGRGGGRHASAIFRGCLRTQHCQQQVDGGTGWEAGNVKLSYSYKRQVEGKSPEGMQLFVSLPVFISISPASLPWSGDQSVGTSN